MSSMKPHRDNRRRIDLPVIFYSAEITQRNGTEFHYGKIRDASRVGMCIETRSPVDFDVGSSLIFHVVPQSPSHELQSAFTTVIKGKVVWQDATRQKIEVQHSNGSTGSTPQVDHPRQTTS